MHMKLTRISHWGAAPNPFLFWFFCGEAAKKPKHKHFSGVCNPQTPALQSGKPLNFMRMGVWGFAPSMGVTCGCVRELGSLTLPILVGFGTRIRAFFCRVQATHNTGETC
jgi:hypothetical protein